MNQQVDGWAAPRPTFHLRVAALAVVILLRVPALVAATLYELNLENGLKASVGREANLAAPAEGTAAPQPIFRKAHLGQGLLLRAASVLELPVDRLPAAGSIELIFLAASPLPAADRVEPLLTCGPLTLACRNGLLYLRRGDQAVYLPVYHWAQKEVVHVVISWTPGAIALTGDGRLAIPARPPWHPPLALPAAPADGILRIGSANNAFELLLDQVGLLDQPYSETEILTRHQSIFTRSILFKRSVVVVPRLEAAPVIDGNLADAAWRAATELTGFFAYNSRLMLKRPSPRVMLGYDDQAFYIGFESPQPEGVVSEAVPRDDKRIVGEHDTFEFFLRPTMTWSHDYYQIIVNPAGSIHDGKIQDPAWNGDFTVRSRVEDGVWRGEIRLPYATFEGAGAPAPGDQWTFNVCRNFRTGGTDLSQWSHTGIVYHNVAGFAEIRFGRTGEWVRERTLNLASGGQLQVWVETPEAMNAEAAMTVYRASEIVPFRTVVPAPGTTLLGLDESGWDGGVADVMLRQPERAYPLYQRMFQF